MRSATVGQCVEPLTLAEAVVAYAETGWEVLALHSVSSGLCSCGKLDCEKPGKHPRTPNGYKNATTDVAKLRSWWDQCPDANIGLALPEGIVVVDIDSPEAMNELKVREYELHATLTVTTARGSHSYYRTDVDVRRTIGKLFPGIDILVGGSGYVIAPPSVHPTGVVYELAEGDFGNPDSIAPAPSWVEREFSKPKERLASNESDRFADGTRNTNLTSFAGAMRRPGMSEASIAAALLVENQERCDPPLGNAEVLQIARSVARYPPGAARGGGSVSFVSTEGGRFEKFLELPPVKCQVPELDTELLPGRLRSWVEDAAERMQLPPECIAVPALISASSLIGPKVRIQPKAVDTDWKVTVNLWGGVVAPPGRMKTAAISEGTKPVRTIEEKLRQHHNSDRTNRAAKLASNDLKVKAIKKSLAEALAGGEDEEATKLESDLASALEKQECAENELLEPRRIVNDTTTEKLGELLRDNPGGLLQTRDELAGLLRSLERDDRKGDREFYLETWAGDGSYVYDRIGRGTIRIPNLCLSIVGGIQPGKFSKYVADAVDGGYAADGLLQRFQLLVWPDFGRDWTLVDRQPDYEGQKAAQETFERLDRISGERVTTFDCDGQALFLDWLTTLERRLRSEDLDESPAFQSHLAKYRSLMPSLALVIHLCEDGEPSAPVSLSCAPSWSRAV